MKEVLHRWFCPQRTGRNRTSLLVLLLCIPLLMWGQTKTISGVVKSATDSEPLIGVNVIQVGTTNGTITDLDGNFELSLPEGAEVELSYIGFLNQRVKLEAGKSNILLREDSQSLDEVVVVGYGVQKKKLLTGATVQVSGDNLQKLSTSSALGALQSQTPGVNITQTSGKPGEGFKVTVRGAGTMGSAGPLYVIDGVAGGDINNLNPSDIESVDVLKDAASAAIYGARAANGVILVTTKQGKSGKTVVTYDGFVGVQNIAKKPDLLNAQQYIDILNKRNRYGATQAENDAFWNSKLPAGMYDEYMSGKRASSNWLDEALNKNALTQNHAINLAGGSELSKFSLGFSYSGQEGIIGKQIDPVFKRYTARINSDHVIYKVGKLDVIKVGENLTFSQKSNKNSVATGNIYSSTVRNLAVAPPVLPAYKADGSYYTQDDMEAQGWTIDDAAGNPLVQMVYSDYGNNYSRNYSLMASGYVEIQPIQNLKFRTVYGYNQSASQSRRYSNPYRFGRTSNTENTTTQEGNAGYQVTWENTLAYSFNINSHAFDAVVGQSIEQWGMGESMRTAAKNNLFGDWKHAYIDNTKPSDLSDITIAGAPLEQGRLASFFGRMNYNYKETYMASVVLRADGSSNFASGKRWGYFPSVSAGWVITNEDFMEPLRNAGFDFFKIRASWGQNGNSNIDGFQYLATIAMDNANVYYFGEDKATPYPGAYADILPNPDVTWETSEQLDFGFDARLLNSRLGINFDWYDKQTKDWLLPAPQLATYGTGAPFINGGDISNKGVEVGLSWNDNIGDFTYGANFNIAFNKNEVTRIANSEGIIHGPTNVLAQLTTEMFRAQEGYPIGYFWGYKTEGVFQSDEQIKVYRDAGKGLKKSETKPGDLIFSDISGPNGTPDGIIDDNDKTMIGDPNPDFTSGLTLTFGYKGFDLAVTAYGAFGHQIARSFRSYTDQHWQNYTTEVYDYWTPENPSNKFPRLTDGSDANWLEVSDIHIEDADFVKLSNLTVGYDFKKLCPKMPFGQARLYLTAQNLFTITSYSGMDPEVGYSYTGDKDYTWTSGIDLGFYPSARTYLVGVNLKF